MSESVREKVEVYREVLEQTIAAAEERGRRRGLEECTPALLEARYWFAANAMPVKTPREAVIARINAALAPRDSAPKKHKCMRCGGEFECSTDGCEPRDSGKVEP